MFHMNTTTERQTMNGKPVMNVPAKSVINMESGFSHKLLCDGPTFSTGTACAYSCAFCYVPAIMEKSPHFAEAKAAGLAYEAVVIRREGALQAMRSQLVGKNGPRYNDPGDTRVIYASPLVDVAANMDLVRETAEACKLILELTNWQIRLLSKSNLLPKVAQLLPESAQSRIIYGLSTGTLDDKLAASFEQGTPKVSKRIEALHWLQDNGYRTFGMICPSLPQRDYLLFAAEMADAIRAERCEHVWAEVINVRGESMTRTCDGLRKGGFEWEADELASVSRNKEAWEAYSRRTFEAHAKLYTSGKLRFLQYVNAGNRYYWQANISNGAILL